MRTASLSEEPLISSCRAFRRPIRVRKYATWWKSDPASSYTCRVNDRRTSDLVLIEIIHNSLANSWSVPGAWQSARGPGGGQLDICRRASSNCCYHQAEPCTGSYWITLVRSDPSQSAQLAWREWWLSSGFPVNQQEYSRTTQIPSKELFAHDFRVTFPASAFCIFILNRNYLKHKTERVKQDFWLVCICWGVVLVP